MLDHFELVVLSDPRPLLERPLLFDEALGLALELHETPSHDVVVLILEAKRAVRRTAAPRVGNAAHQTVLHVLYSVVRLDFRRELADKRLSDRTRKKLEGRLCGVLFVLRPKTQDAP